MSYNGWMLPDAERARVLAMFPPRFALVKATHVTLSIRDTSGLPIPMDAEIKIIGYASDDGVEALIVSVDNDTRRPDNSTYHLTLSVAEGRASKESNDVIERNGFDVIGDGFEEDQLTLRTRGFVSSGDGRYIVSPFSAR